MKRIYIIKYNQRLLEMPSSIGRSDYKCAHWWGVHPQSHYLQQLLLQILQNKVDQITPPPHKREIVKGFNQIETKQGDSKWIKVTWLKWPLHINVTSIINNFGGKHIQLPAHWSPFARETANSHGVTGCEYHLTVVLPCDGLLALSVQKWWSWLLSPIKRVEAVAALCRISDNSPPRTPHPPPPTPPRPAPPPAPLHCVCFSAGLRALISGAEIWQSHQVMTEAVVRSHPEPQRRLAFQADEGLAQYPKHKEIL